MWRFSRRPTPALRLALITEYDRSLITLLIVAKSPALRFGHVDVDAHQKFGSIARTLIGASVSDLEWLETATEALGGHVLYMPARSATRRTIDRETRSALADSMNDVVHATARAAEGDAVLSGTHSTGRLDDDLELHRLVEQGRAVLRRTLDRDAHLVGEYTTKQHVDAVAVLDRHADRQRYEALRDEYEMHNGGVPAVWPF